MACRTGCTTKSHNSYAECLREGAPRVLYANSAKGFDYSTEKKWHADIDYYRSAVAEGMEPSGTSRAQVDAAKAISDSTGTAYQADL